MEQEFIARQELLEELDVKHEPYCEGNKGSIIISPNVISEKPPNRSSHSNVSDQNSARLYMPIKKETVLSKEIAELQKILRPYEDKYFHSGYQSKTIKEEPSQALASSPSNYALTLNQDEGNVVRVPSKRSLKRKRQRLRKQQAKLEQASEFQPQTGDPLAETEGSRLEALSKTPRQSNGTEEQKPKTKAKMASGGPYSFTKEQESLAVAFYCSDNTLVDANLADKIRDRLRKLILKAIREQEDSDKLSFANSGLVADGFFLVTPMNVFARDWLLACNLGFYNGVEIKMTRRDCGTIVVWVPGKKKLNNPLEYLQIQNSKRTELQLPKWYLIVRNSLPLGERLIFGVPQKVCHLLGKEGVWLNYELTRVNAKLLGPKTKKKSDPDLDMTDT